MKAKINIEMEVEITTLSIKAGVRHWEDATVNDIEDDEDGPKIPCRDGEYWCPKIDIETGIITNWTKGVTADIHYKVCDNGTYYLKNSLGETLLTKEGYVPSILDLTREGYGDYIILKIDENGKISNWNNNPNIEDFKDND